MKRVGGGVGGGGVSKQNFPMFTSNAAAGAPPPPPDESGWLPGFSWPTKNNGDLLTSPPSPSCLQSTANSHLMKERGIIQFPAYSFRLTRNWKPLHRPLEREGATKPQKQIPTRVRRLVMMATVVVLLLPDRGTGPGVENEALIRGSE